MLPVEVFLDIVGVQRSEIAHAAALVSHGLFGYLNLVVSNFSAYSLSSLTAATST